jgi:FkbM family methyltransferase
MMGRLRSKVNEKRLNFVSLIRKIRLRYALPKTETAHLQPSIQINKKWYGNSYGGFYIHPDLLSSSSVVYSIGIGKDISFDKKVMKNHQCFVFAFDPTPKSIAYIESLRLPKLFQFNPFGIALESGFQKFYLPKNERAVSASTAMNSFVNENNAITVEMKSWEDITKDLGHTEIDVLKIDIEGAEYEIIPAITTGKVFVKQLLIEFHDRFFEEPIRSKAAVDLLKEAGYEIFAASLNYEEISFIHRSALE